VVGGSEVPFTPDNPPPVTEEVLDHIIVGEPRDRGRRWSGGHGYGHRGFPNFPRSWDREKIRTAIQRVLAGPPGLVIIRRGSTLHFYATTDEVAMEVRVRGRPGPPVLWTALPDPRRLGKRD
jgi:hypothetical protein